jgi:hypothetical protein
MSREVKLIVAVSCRINDLTWTERDLLDSVPDYLLGCWGRTKGEADPYDLNDVTVWTAVGFHADLAEGALPDGYGPPAQR